TKTHLVIADETGRVLGFGESGPANHQSVGYGGMFDALRLALGQALASAGLGVDGIRAAAFGVAGYDWPSQKPVMVDTIERLGLAAPSTIVNDAISGLVAGSEEGWGVSVVSGTGCNCRGWDRQHKREGRVTGFGSMVGEAAGATELIYRAMQMIAFAWTKRGPATTLADAFVAAAGARSVEDLLEGYTTGRYRIRGETTPVIFRHADQGDGVAAALIEWAGVELGEMACAVIRQLEMEALAFDTVLAGSMFEGGPRLIEPMRRTILATAPKARLVRLKVPAVAGAVLLAMMEAGLEPDGKLRGVLADSLRAVRRAVAE
ncbi:MAG: N-acetylglucosamine kinase, partial [Anaerolineales bacterium]